MNTDDIVILTGSRTPMGALHGELSSLTAPQLGATAISAALSSSNVNANAVDEIYMGCVLPAGLKQCPARQAAIGAAIPMSAGAVTVNKACGSGMQAVMFAADSLRAGTNKVVVAGGMESMSNAPHLIPNARSGVRAGHKTIYDHMFLDGLEDAYTGRSMGSFAQETADEKGIGRERMDEFAISSLTRAQHATASGALSNEITPVLLSTRKGDVTITEDEQPRNANIEKIPSLRPAFAKDGSITAANASSISDGASALVLTTANYASQHALTPTARLVAHARHSQAPGEFTLAPIGAIEKLLAKTAWQLSDVDLFEINEAFAMVTLLAIDSLQLDSEKVNVFGGACAQGHPIGSTGSRIIVTLINALQQRGGKRGIAALCIGGGEATAVAVELI